jgi:putative ABC transport system ATP-binding protein
MEEKANIVRVTNVTKVFKLGKINVEALKGIDLEIAKGNYISIMGPSGSGKSTLFNMIGGLEGLHRRGRHRPAGCIRIGMASLS